MLKRPEPIGLSGRSESNNSACQARSATTWLRPSAADVLLVYSLALFILGGFRDFLWVYSDSVQQAFRSRSLLEINAGGILALAAIYSIVKSKNSRVLLSKADLAVLSACAMLFLPPEPRLLPYLGATIAGLYLWRRGRSDFQLTSVGQLWIAISVYKAWGPLVFQIVSAAIIQAEVAIIAKLGHLLGFGISLDGVALRSPSGWSVFVLEPCSSFHNVSLAILVWLSLVKLGGSEVTRLNLAALAVGVVAIIGLNALRILLMTPSQEAFLFWHEGTGATLFSCFTLAAIGFPTTVSLQKNG